MNRLKKEPFAGSFFDINSSIRGSHHIQDVGGISGECLPVTFQFLRKFKEKLAALIIPLKEGHKQEIPLGQIGSRLAGIAVCG